MRQPFLDLIAREVEHQRAGRSGRIIAKMNQLEDPTIIAALCDASRAGVSVDLIVRGFCCLRPGVAGVSDAVRVRSIVGRFLEHSRIFYFADGSLDPMAGTFYIGSADWMFRNLSHRVEVAAPIRAPGARRRLWEILDVLLKDQRQAWRLESDGTYSQLLPDSAAAGAEAFGSQAALLELARRNAHA
jgi:polyphosphate kinase